MREKERYSHVGEEPPDLVSPPGVVYERGAVGDGSSPGDGYTLTLGVCDREDGVEVDGELGHGEEDHDEGGGRAGELLHVGEDLGYAGQGGLLLRVEPVLLYHV